LAEDIFRRYTDEINKIA
jgi:hypothetical protein